MATPESLKENPFFPVFEKQQNNKQRINLRSVKKRIQILSRLEQQLHRFRIEIQEALYKDFKKPVSETDITELYPVLGEIRFAKANLRNWMRPVPIDNSLAFVGTKSTLIQTAKGVCLIISTWNYPIALTFGPLVSAIAAGNTIIIKPSETTPFTSALIKKIVEELFPEEEVAIIEGDGRIAQKLLELPFDHIFFTGSRAVGEKVMHAAAQHLTSFTLELGGKSPVYIHHDANINDAAAKITAAKLVNAGQTCIAPDYILVHQDLKEHLILALDKAFTAFYNKNNRGEQVNFASIVDQRHYNRLEELLHTNKRHKEVNENLLFEPVIIKDAKISDPVMMEEIFGPVLPVLGVLNEEEAIKIIHTLPEPLCIYIFTRDRKTKNHFKNNTRSGSICYNDCAVHFLNPALPFGGIHQSGIGRAHGKAGFLSFSEQRVVFEQRIGFTMAKMLYPPYGPLKKKLIDLLLKYF